jgi:anti-anti-sigma regulatory factor
MTSDKEITADCDYFALEGTVDFSSEQLLKKLPAQVKKRRVRFDFSRTGRINSMGVALLLRCFKEIRDNGAEITVSGLAPMHTMLFKMTGLFLLATPGADAE